MVFLFRSYVFLLRLDIFLLRLNRYMKGSRLSLCFHALIVLIMLEKYMKTVIEVLYPHICISWCLLSSVYFLIFWPAMHCNAWLVSNLVWGVPSIKLLTIELTIERLWKVVRFKQLWVLVKALCSCWGRSVIPDIRLWSYWICPHFWLQSYFFTSQCCTLFVGPL